MARGLRFTAAQLDAMTTTRQAHDQRARGTKHAAPPAKQLEHAEQSEFFAWWRDYAKLKRLPECLCFAVPNGWGLTDAGRIYQWQQGMTAGVFDVFLSIARGTWHGLYMEFKAGNNKPTLRQEEFMASVLEQEYRAVVVWSARDATKIATDYLNGL